MKSNRKSLREIVKNDDNFEDFRRDSDHIQTEHSPRHQNEAAARDTKAKKRRVRKKKLAISVSRRSLSPREVTLNHPQSTIIVEKTRKGNRNLVELTDNHIDFGKIEKEKLIMRH